MAFRCWQGCGSVCHDFAAKDAILSWVKSSWAGQLLLVSTFLFSFTFVNLTE